MDEAVRRALQGLSRDGRRAQRSGDRGLMISIGLADEDESVRPASHRSEDEITDNQVNEQERRREASAEQDNLTDQNQARAREVERAGDAAEASRPRDWIDDIEKSPDEDEEDD